MVVTLYLDTDSNIEHLLPWGLRLSVVRGKEIRLVVASSQASQGSCEPADPDSDVAGQLREALNHEFGPEGWSELLVQESSSENSKAEETPSEVPSFEFLLTGPGTEVATWLHPAEGDSSDSLIAVQPRVEKEDSESSERRRQIFARAMCEVVMLRPGSGDDDERGGVMVAAGRGPHARAAMQWAQELNQAGGGPVQALIVQRNIGADSHGVGRRTLTHLLDKNVGAAHEFSQTVVVNDHRHVGIVDAYTKGSADLVLLGATKLGGLEQRWRGTVSQKVMRATDEPTIGIVRAPVPLSGRAQRLLAAWFHRTVPQLERDQRLSLVERVQSNSHWDFDFVTLMSLSTLIAASGLIVNSSAIIIGAMLVAPLMTPIMGVGMALVQGNPRLIRMALRSVGLGFLTAFLFGVLLGAFQPELREPTTEMLARNWPGALDLFVAFVAGLAGVYSSSRPNLVAALPGVAIAAALVPPIATAGVALSMGEFDLSMGASLLFLTNFVAIVLASAGGLWAVGMRQGQTGSRWTRISGSVITTLAVVMAIGLSLAPSRHRSPGTPPVELREGFEARLGSAHRIVEIELVPGEEAMRVRLELSGTQPPTRELVRELSRIAERVMGESVIVRVRSAWEFEATSHPDTPEKPKSPPPAKEP